MAIRVQTIGATDLRLAANVTKTINWNNARSGGALDGLIVGHWRGMMLQMPGSGTTNADLAILGVDNAGSTPNGNFSSANDTVLRIGANNAGRGITQMRPLVRAGSPGGTAFSTTEGTASTLPMFADMVGTLMVWGINYLEHLGVPAWHGWVATCRLDTGAVSSYVAPTPIASGWITSTGTSHLFRQMFAAFGTSGARTPINFTAEQLALAEGDFPWDTLNDANTAGVGRPHHDAIAALAGFGSNPFLTYADLAAAQAAGTLPYPNCAQGRSDLRHHWTLRNLATGLTNNGTAGSATLAQTDHNSLTGGLIDVLELAPSHWYGGAPTIIEPPNRFIGGRGLLAAVVGGARQSGQGVQRRWEDQASGNALPGLDWAAVSTPTSTTWQTSDTLPVGGPYRLVVRDTAIPANTSSSSGWQVGTVVLLHGQSGMELSLRGGGSISGPNLMGTNYLNLAIDAGAQGVVVKLAFQKAIDGAGYGRPAMIGTSLVGGTTPANVGQGTVAMLNEWNAHNPGHPLMIVNMAIDGTSMGAWADNAAVEAAQPSWRFMGTIDAVADGASGNNSGVVEAYAAYLRRRTDAHAIMWTPGMSSVATGASSRALYVAGIDARFSNSPTAPWLVFPPWRSHRPPNDASAQITKRQEHLDFAAELGSRAIVCSAWPDTVMDNTGGLHAATGNPAGTPVFAPIPDTNRVGASRIAPGIGRWLARLYNQDIKAAGPVLVGAWWGNAGRTVIEVEVGRQVRTLNSAAIAALFWVSTDGGTTWSQTGYTLALSPDGTRVVITSTGGAWPETTTRVDYARQWPFDETAFPDETLTERNLDGVLYDNQQHRGGVNFAPGARAGNPLVGSSRVTAGGIPVTARGAAKLVSTEARLATKNATVRMVVTGGSAVEKAVSVGVGA